MHFRDVAEQAGGAFVALVGIIMTVAGLIGVKHFGKAGTIQDCNKGWRWAASVLSWCVGQLLQLCAVELATTPVVTAVATLAVPTNALLAWKFLGEPLTRMELLAIVAMTIGAGMVVFSAPQQGKASMTVAQVGDLFTASWLPAIGSVVTGLVACAAAFAVRRPARRPGGSSESMGFGVLAGVSGASSITAAKLCWMLFDDTVSGGQNAFLQPALYLIGVFSALGEAGMAVALFYGLARGESTMVVPAYYISMNVTGSGQGLCLFGKFKCFTAVTGPVFGIGVLLACVAVALMAAWRRAPVASERGTPLMEEVAAPSGSARIRTAAAAEAAAPPTAYMGE